MRLPAFTAAATLSQPVTASYWAQATPPTTAEVRPAISVGQCLRTCTQSGADGCLAFCLCHSMGGSHCPVLF